MVGGGGVNIEMHKRSNFSRLDTIGRPWRRGGGGGGGGCKERSPDTVHKPPLFNNGY